MEETETILASVNGHPVTLQGLLRSPLLQDHIRHVLELATERHLVLEACAWGGVSATADELQAAFNGLRRDLGLFSGEKTKQWLRERHLTLDDVEQDVRYLVLQRKWRAHLALKTEPYFHEHRARFQHVALSKVLVSDRDLAAELLAELDEGEVTFETLVQRNSRDEATRSRGGYWGEFNRQQLSADICSAVFGAHAGAVLGPFADGHGFMLLKVLARRDGTLDDPTRESIAHMLYQQWLAQERHQARIELLPRS